MEGGSLWRVGDSTSRLLLSVAAGEDIGEDTETVVLDRAELIHLGSQHGLLGMMADSGLKGLAGAVAYQHLAQRARQIIMGEHLRRILTDLHDAGVRASVLKGPYVAVSYAQPRWRTFSDLDILVPPLELESALEVLGADLAVREIPPKRPKADKRDVPLHDESGLVFALDLHWDLFSYTQLLGGARGATQWAWDHARLDIHHRLGPLWHLPPGPQICFLCTHALLDHRFRLILFRDLLELAQDEATDWAAVVEFASDFALRTTTYVSLLIAKRLLGAEIPEEALEEARLESPLMRLVEFLLPRTDLVRFDGHRPHPLNLAVVLLHDRIVKQLALALRTPLAAPEWTRRVGWRPFASHRRVNSDARPSVEILVTSTRRRGAEVFGQRLADGLSVLGWKARLSSLTTGDEEPRVRARPVSNRRSDDLGRLNLDVIRGLRRMLRRERPAMILANGSSTLQYSVIARLGLRPRPLLIYSAIGEPEYWIRSLRQRLANRILLAGTDHVIAVSEEGRRQLVDVLGVAPDKISVEHTGVPGSFLDLVSESRPDRLRMVFVGNLSPEKGPEVAIEVVHQLRTRGTEAVLRFVGSGPLRERLSEMAEERRVADSVQFVGSVSQVEPHLIWADVMLLTSRTEGLPAAVIEAAAAGVPAVAFDVGGTRETIIDGSSGILVPRGDVNSFVEALQMLARREDVRTGMGKAAKDHVVENFTIEAALQRYDRRLRLIAERFSLG